MTLRTTIRNFFGRKLRCWPGAVALVVDDGSDPFNRLFAPIGATITCRALTKSVSGKPSWTYEGKPLQMPLYGDVECIPDAMLVPLTPPPGKEVKPEVLELPTPKRETEKV